MARALTIQRTIVPPTERKRYLEKAKLRKAYYTRAKCSFWVFEDARVPGDFTEFAEAPDAETLSAAHASAADPAPGGSHLLTEVALT